LSLGGRTPGKAGVEPGSAVGSGVRIRYWRLL